MSDDRPRLWTSRELAEYTGIPIRTLADWWTERVRSRGLGSPFVALSGGRLMARPKRALGELGKATYTVEPNGVVIARARVHDGNGQERRPSRGGPTEAEALAALPEAADVARRSSAGATSTAHDGR